MLHKTIPPIFDVLNLATTGTPGPQRSVAFYMFVLVTSLLILFFAIVALGAAVRLTRRYRKNTLADQRLHQRTNINPEIDDTDEDDVVIDPWQEAGRRLSEGDEEAD